MRLIYFYKLHLEKYMTKILGLFVFCSNIDIYKLIKYVQPTNKSILLVSNRTSRFQTLDLYLNNTLHH